MANEVDSLQELAEGINREVDNHVENIGLRGISCREVPHGRRLTFRKLGDLDQNSFPSIDIMIVPEEDCLRFDVICCEESFLEGLKKALVSIRDYTLPKTGYSVEASECDPEKDLQADQVFTFRVGIHMTNGA